MNVINTIINGFRDIRGLAAKLFGLWLIGVAIIAVICICGVLINNTIRTPPNPLEYEVIEFTPCTGWNSAGESQEKNVFLPDERNISACGNLQTNRPITLSIYWYYDGKIIQRDIISGVENQFLSELTSADRGEVEGSYELRLVIGKTTVSSATFTVVPP